MMLLESLAYRGEWTGLGCVTVPNTRVSIGMDGSHAVDTAYRGTYLIKLVGT